MINQHDSFLHVHGKDKISFEKYLISQFSHSQIALDQLGIFSGLSLSSFLFYTASYQFDLWWSMSSSVERDSRRSLVIVF